MGLLNCSHRSKEDFLDGEAEEDGQEDTHVCQNHETGIALGEVDACRVKVGPFVECGEENAGCKRSADGAICDKTHLFMQLSASLEP